MHTGLAVGVDVGGTKIAAGLVGGDGSVVRRERRDTPATVEALIDAIGALAEELTPDGVAPLPVGVGIASLVDLDGVARFGPNLPGENIPLDELLTARLRAEVEVDNDANVAAWGEYRAGAGQGARAMLMLTIGTGVGGGIVLEGRLVRGGFGFAADVGHIVVNEGGRRCPCGNLGCLEAYASGTAIGEMAQEAAEAGRILPGTPLAMAGVLTGKSVTTAAHAGDPVAEDVLATAGFWLGVGIGSLLNALDPDVVVIGGGAMQAGELLLAPAREASWERVLGAAYRPRPRIVRAQLGDDAGVVGAALHALEALRD